MLFRVLALRRLWSVNLHSNVIFVIVFSRRSNSLSFHESSGLLDRAEIEPITTCMMGITVHARVD